MEPTHATTSDAVDTRPTREELERQLQELDTQAEADLAPTTDEDDDAFTRPTVQVHNKFLGRDITIIRPTDVDLMMFQNDMGSRSLNDSQRMARNGDFCRDHVDTDDYEEWSLAVRDRAARDPRRGAVVFYEALQELVEIIADQTEQTDENEMKQATNRAQRRAALRAKADRAR